MPLVLDMHAPGMAGQGIAAAVDALRRGRLVGMPTETVYGLAADAGNPAAVAAIYEAKGRPRFNPLIVHVDNLAAAERLADFDANAARLAAAFWPGPLTLVLPRRADAGIAELATAGLPTVALRVPAHPVARDLIAAFGGPLVAPSANRSGHVSAASASDVVDDLGDRVAVVLDAGNAEVGIESTIVALGAGGATLLRPGGLSRDRIEAVLGRPLASPAGDPPQPVAPGMLASHYAPSVPLRLTAGDVRPGEALLAFGPPPPAAAGAAWVINLSPSGNLTEAATRLFPALRALERYGAPVAAMLVPEVGLGEAINDRLRRAAAPRG